MVSHMAAILEVQIVNQRAPITFMTSSRRANAFAASLINLRVFRSNLPSPDADPPLLWCCSRTLDSTFVTGIPMLRASHRPLNSELAHSRTTKGPTTRPSHAMPRPPSFQLPRSSPCCREDTRPETYTSKQLNRMFDIAVRKGEAKASKYIDRVSKKSSSKKSKGY
ncbi:hypothetical protein PTSG_07585 [Salpingoeca rosetta]|uniref:Uncharacterized protein n=1 Tax=Salpingoeca rosetta (strain ATCC 50818 / BSB-021) TaxID=946362 RepID=F2UH69_SALR5|nr:uncharacterized protein PTSG_07585 [Salpingoeca rosetta]EGD76468.1 hypothetical protein PTSG_07585 [Salpingoeca rosetta]|eukprot:XP_004991383.1 hypothetical protein PTSG_07585 [Salpingoeca rosetta]